MRNRRTPPPRNSRLYQLNVRSDFELWGRTVDGLEFDIEFIRAVWDDVRPFDPSESTLKYDNPAADVTLHRQGDWHCLQYLGVGEFFFCDARKVICHIEKEASEVQVSSILHGPVLAVMLELRGTTCLHASAVQVGDRAVVLLGHTGAGKSTFAAQLVMEGSPLVTDDILPVSTGETGCIALPGYPQMKLCPDVAEQFSMMATDRLALGKHLQRVGHDWGRFAPRPLPLAVGYLLESSDSVPATISIEQLDPTARFVELVRFSFCARVVGPLGLDEVHFHRLGKITERIVLYRFRYGRGIANLPAACRALVHHAESACTA